MTHRMTINDIDREARVLGLAISRAEAEFEAAVVTLAVRRDQFLAARSPIERVRSWFAYRSAVSRRFNKSEALFRVILYRLERSRVWITQFDRGYGRNHEP